MSDSNVTPIKTPTVYEKDNVDREKYLRRSMPYGRPGYTITITDDFKFIAEGPDLNVRVQNVDLNDAKKRIDDLIALKAKQKATKFSKIVANEDGSLCTVIGLTRNEGDLKLTGNQSVNSYVYPNEPWVVTMLKERARLSKSIEAMDKKLQVVAVRASGWAYRGISAESYADKLDRFDNEISTAENNAKNLTPKD